MFYSKSTGGFYSTEINGANIPADAVEITPQEHVALLRGQASGKIISARSNGKPELADPPAPDQSEIIKMYESALDAHMDSVAKMHRYDNRFTFALRAGYAGPYHAEGAAFAVWMDQCNVKAFGLLNDVLDGKAAMPSIEDFIAGLPAFVLP